MLRKFLYRYLRHIREILREASQDWMSKTVIYKVIVGTMGNGFMVRVVTEIKMKHIYFGSVVNNAIPATTEIRIL